MGNNKNTLLCLSRIGESNFSFFDINDYDEMCFIINIFEKMC